MVNNLQKFSSLALGILFLLIGILGFFTNNVLGIFSTNLYLSIIHIITGIFGIYSSIKGFGTDYNIIIGWVFVLLGVFGLIPGIGDVMVNLLGINITMSILHLIIGIFCVVVYFGFGEE